MNAFTNLFKKKDPGTALVIAEPVVFAPHFELAERVTMFASFEDYAKNHKRAGKLFSFKHDDKLIRLELPSMELNSLHDHQRYIHLIDSVRANLDGRYFRWSTFYELANWCEIEKTPEVQEARNKLHKLDFVNYDIMFKEIYADMFKQISIALSGPSKWARKTTILTPTTE